jgi:hypothetical protein
MEVALEQIESYSYYQVRDETMKPAVLSMASQLLGLSALLALVTSFSRLGRHIGEYTVHGSGDLTFKLVIATASAAFLLKVLAFVGVIGDVVLLVIITGAALVLAIATLVNYMKMVAALTRAVGEKCSLVNS